MIAIFRDYLVRHQCMSAFVVPPLPEESLGVTPPIFVQGPSAEDSASDEAMKVWLDANYPRETKVGMLKRWRILIELERLANDWVSGVLGTDSRPSTAGNSSSGLLARVLTFGSFRLGVINQASDIDTLILLPLGISRDRFFAEFPAVLSALPEVSDCNAVADARVPVVKAKYRGIYLDILVARVPDKYLDPLQENIEDSLIFQVEEKCMKSMNGVRVADKILSLVPDPAVFRSATRMIKHWAQQRGIYSNAIGYVGGVSFALMTAKVCQLYPNLSAKQIVERFFYTFDSWGWNENKPIMLGPILDSKIPGFALNRAAQFREWNGVKYPQDKLQPMPIITPIFPTHNTAYNVTETQKSIILSEIKRGKEIVELMYSTAHVEGPGRVTWDDLCSPFPFFEAFDKFIVLELTAESDVLLLKFKGLVESRMRSFIKALEELAGVSARPHCDFFGADYGGCFYLGLSAAREATFDLNHAVQSFYTETMEKSLLNPEWGGGGSGFSLLVKVISAEALRELDSLGPKVKRMRVE